MPNYEEAKNKALDLLTEYNINEPVVPVFNIAKNKGIDIKFFANSSGKLNNVSGLFDAKTKTIYVNDEDPPNRKTFTVAHELGHHILKHEPDKYGVLPRFANPTDTNSNNDLEKEANCFAANLLVPERMLKEIMNKYNLSKSDANLLSKMFGVSKDVMKYRLERV